MRTPIPAFRPVRLGLVLILLRAFQPAIAPNPFQSDLTHRLIDHAETDPDPTAPSSVSRTLHTLTDSFARLLRPFHPAPSHQDPVPPLPPIVLQALQTDRHKLTTLLSTLYRHPPPPTTNTHTLPEALQEMYEEDRPNDELSRLAIQRSIHIAQQASARFALTRRGSSASWYETASYIQAIQQAAETFTAELEQLRRLEILYTFIEGMAPSDGFRRWLLDKMRRRRGWAVTVRPVLEEVVQSAREHRPTFEMLELDEPKRRWAAFEPLKYFEPIPVETLESGERRARWGVKMVSPGQEYPLGLEEDGGLGPHGSASSGNDQAGPSGSGAGGNP